MTGSARSRMALTVKRCKEPMLALVRTRTFPNALKNCACFCVDEAIDCARNLSVGAATHSITGGGRGGGGGDHPGINANARAHVAMLRHDALH